MKIKKSTCTVAVLLCGLMVLVAGCNQTPSTPQPIRTNALSTATIDQHHYNEFTVSEKTMQVTLTTELSKISRVVSLGRGLYFFTANQSEALDSVSSYMRENTNIIMIAVISANENHGNTWIVGDTTIDLKHFPTDLNISNGVFAIFADKP
jgi:hypothetical protein